MIPASTSSSLFAEGSYNEGQLAKHIKKSVKIISLFLIPGIILLLLAGNYILLFFGANYASQGSGFLELLAISGIFMAINSVYGSVLRVRKKVGSLIVISIIGAVLILGLSYWFISHKFGLIGIGWAWLIGQAVMSGVYVTTEPFLRK
jgi:O-antigen/teichoic acid export membrane protein